jgi:ribosomal protein L37E
MPTKRTEFNLINNARDSLDHAVEHLSNPDGIQARDLKLAIRDVAHVVELLLKERLKNTHTAFMYQSIDKYKSKGAFTVDTKTAINRLLTICNIALDDSAKKTIEACRDIRNDIEHYQFIMDPKEARGIIGRMLSFIFDFSKRYLNLDLEEEFRADDRWKSLVEIYAFWEAHGKVIERQLAEQDKPHCGCPSCSADTFDISSSECLLCGHVDEETQCYSCGEPVWLSQAHKIQEVDVDPETGPYEHEIIICDECFERQNDHASID